MLGDFTWVNSAIAPRQSDRTSEIYTVLFIFLLGLTGVENQPFAVDVVGTGNRTEWLTKLLLSGIDFFYLHWNDGIFSALIPHIFKKMIDS